LTIRFFQRLQNLSRLRSSRIILALDFTDISHLKLEEECIRFISELGSKIIAVKINYHILLPLDLRSVKRIIDAAHKLDILAIADMKLNDISSTNLWVGQQIWRIGFDSIIVNPIVGLKEGLASLIDQAHALDRGVIFLVYMSHKGSEEGYGLRVVNNNGNISSIHEIFLNRAIKWKADGVIVGATNPSIILKASYRLAGRIPIFSPGVGIQGGSHVETVKAGADFLIIGRTILNSDNPKKITEKIRYDTWHP